jgi:ABC-type Fe3+/spermidine/putrescine transport system ATPase subunit
MNDQRTETHPAPRPSPAIEVEGLAKAFEHGRIPALRGADLTVDRGEFIAIMGP